MKLTAAMAVTALLLAGCSLTDTTAVPEGGWNAAELNEKFYIGEAAVGFPCTLDDLRQGFERVEPVQLDNTDSEKIGLSGGSCYYLIHDGTAVGAAFDNDENGTVECLSFYSDMAGAGREFTAPVKLNGVTLGSTRSEVEERLGEVTDSSDGGFTLFLMTGGTDVTVHGKNDRVTKLEIKGE